MLTFLSRFVKLKLAQDSNEGRVQWILSEGRAQQSWIGWRDKLPSLADEIPLSGRGELHLQDFTAPLFITWLCQVGHH